MNTLLQWAWPHICLSTTRIKPLPTIVEDTKEDDGKQGSKSGVVSKKRGIANLKAGYCHSYGRAIRVLTGLRKWHRN